MNIRTVVKVTVLLAYVLVAYYAVPYLAGAVFAVLSKQLPDGGLTLETFQHLWQASQGDPAGRSTLKTSLFVSAAAYVAMPVAALMARRARGPALHGDARFANVQEVKAADLDADKGIIVGKYRGRYLVFGGQQFALLAAPTRSGKGVGVVIPNLLNWPDSAVVLDVKLENFAITSGFRAKHGQTVYLFNPFAPDGKTHRWNPLSGINKDPNLRVGDIQAIGTTFYPAHAGSTDATAAFFNEQAQNLFMGLVLYLTETPSLPCTMGEVLRQGSGYGKPLRDHIGKILKERSQGPDALSRTCRDALMRFASNNSENAFNGIKATFEAPLLVFANPVVDAATSGDDFDLADLRAKRMTVYLGVQPNRLESASRLLNVFWSQLVNLNTEQQPDQNPALKYQCLLLADEFTAMGRIPVIEKSVAFLAGYGLRLLPIVQSLEQIEHTYGAQAATNFIKNHDLKIIFAPDDIDEAERLSRALGFRTQKAVSVSTSRAAGAGNTSRRSRSHNESDQRRALLLPQEIRELPRTRQIILKTNCKPILCQKIRYFEEKVFMARVLDPIDIAPISLTSPRSEIHPEKAPVAQEAQHNTARKIDIHQLALDSDNIPPHIDNPRHPTPAQATSVVSAFFDQIDWHNDPATEATSTESIASEAKSADQPTIQTRAGHIDLAILER